MAGSTKEVRISLKMLADVTDAKKLTEYIDKLDEGLKRAGGAGADALSKKLADIRKSLGKSDGAATTVKGFASQVSAMMPDISKSKAFGSIDAIDKKLATYGTAQAKAIQRTVGEIKNALSSGELSTDTIGILEKSLAKFVEQANKLPPPGMKKFGEDIRKVVANTQELQEVIAETNGIEFKVKTAGLGTLDELMHKIEVIESAKGLEDGVNALSDALATLDPGRADEVSKKIERIRALLKGELGAKEAKELQRIMREIGAEAGKLGEKDLHKVGAQIEAVTQQANALGQSIRNSGNAAADSLNDASLAMDLFGFQATTAQKFVVALAAKIPLIGKALSSIPIVWVLAGLAAIIKGMTDVWETWKNAKQAERDTLFNNAKSVLDSMNEESERYNRILTNTLALENQELEIKKEQREAAFELLKAQRDLNREKEKYGLKTEKERAEVDEKYNRIEREATVGNSRAAIAEEQAKLQSKIDDLNKRIARLDKEKKVALKTQLSAGEMAWRESDEIQGNNWLLRLWENSGEGGTPGNYNFVRVFNPDFWTGVDHKKESDHYQKLADRAKEDEKRISQELFDKRKALKEAVAKQELIAKKIAEIDEREAASKQREAEERRQRLEREARNRHEQEREDYTRGRDEREEQRDYERTKSEYGQSDDMKLANQRVEMTRWEREMNRKKTELEAFRKEKPQDVNLWNEDDKVRFRELKEDYDRSRGKFRSAQSSVDALEYSLGEGAKDRTREESLRKRNEDEAQRAYEHGRAEVGQGGDIQLQHQQSELERWKSREDELEAAREKIMTDFYKSGRRGMNADEQRALNEATQDLDEARQKRYAAQEQIDALKLQLSQSAHARTREEEVYEYDRDKQERDYQRGKRQPWQNLDQQLVEAEKELVRYAKEENEALEIRNGILQKLKREGRTEMSQEEQTLFSEATSDLTRSRSSRYTEQQNVDSLKKQIHDRQFERGMSDYAERREDADWARSGQYQRGNWAQRLRMDRQRYEEGRRMYEEADAAIRADEAGTKTLSPEERRVMERNRQEGREKMTSTRDSIRNALYEGDMDKASFFKSLMGHGNRLTAMGLGGDVADWDKQTARNTKQLVKNTEDLLSQMRERDTASGKAFGWGM